MIGRRVGRVAVAVVAVLALPVVVFLVWAHTLMATASDEETRDGITAAVAQFLGQPSS